MTRKLAIGDFVKGVQGNIMLTRVTSECDDSPEVTLGLQPSPDEMLTSAMTLMRGALVLLDQSGVADVSSVHLDLAIQRLNDLVTARSADSLQDLAQLRLPEECV